MLESLIAALLFLLLRAGVQAAGGQIWMMISHMSVTVSGEKSHDFQKIMYAKINTCSFKVLFVHIMNLLLHID